MAKITRRSFVGIMAASTTALSMPSIAFGALPRVVVIGGGAGGGPVVMPTLVRCGWLEMKVKIGWTKRYFEMSAVPQPEQGEQDEQERDEL